MAWRLHTCYTLQKWKYLENCNLHNRVLRVSVPPESPSLRVKTVVYILNQCRQLSFVLLLSPSITRYSRNLISLFWYQPVPLTMAHPCDPIFTDFRVKLQKLRRHILCTGGHQQLANVTLCVQATAANIATGHCLVTQTLRYKLSSSSALHFCVSASFNTWTTRSSSTRYSSRQPHPQISAQGFDALYRLTLPGLHASLLDTLEAATMNMRVTSYL